MLDTRALNRATLARQWLLERQPASAEAAIEHLVGLQAQAPLAPYVALWSRLANFENESLSALISERRAVRASLMRGTIHLATARDALTLRALVAPVLERTFRGTTFGRAVLGLDLDEIVATGRALLEERPRTRTELAPLLQERWPDADAEGLVYAVSYLMPNVQVPPRGVWGTSGPARWAPMESWLGHPVDPDPSLDDVVLRYLASFGPATPRDFGYWSGLTRLAPVFERLRPRLESFRDESGRELFDLPDAPRPDPDTPAPVRFLPEYDNLLIGHADRSRVIPPGRSLPLAPGNGGVMGTVLLDGMFDATWRISRERERATLAVEPLAAINAGLRTEIVDEAAALLAFVAPEHEPEIVVTAPSP